MRKAPGADAGKSGARGLPASRAFSFIWGLYVSEAQCRPMAHVPSAVAAGACEAKGGVWRPRRR
eukprot:9106934-Alexandrium_andersonii.AAC.1